MKKVVKKTVVGLMLALIGHIAWSVGAVVILLAVLDNNNMQILIAGGRSVIAGIGIALKGESLATPGIEMFHNYKQARDEERIRAWWQNWREEVRKLNLHE
jgi:hypothetical protein